WWVKRWIAINARTGKSIRDFTAKLVLKTFLFPKRSHTNDQLQYRYVSNETIQSFCCRPCQSRQRPAGDPFSLFLCSSHRRMVSHNRDVGFDDCLMICREMFTFDRQLIALERDHGQMIQVSFRVECSHAAGTGCGNCLPVS